MHILQQYNYTIGVYLSFARKNPFPGSGIRTHNLPTNFVKLRVELEGINFQPGRICNSRIGNFASTLSGTLKTGQLYISHLQLGTTPFLQGIVDWKVSKRFKLLFPSKYSWVQNLILHFIENDKLS